MTMSFLGTGAIVKRAVVVADENVDDSLAIRSFAQDYSLNDPDNLLSRPASDWS